MRLAEVGDIHGREFFEPFRYSVTAVDDPDLFLLAGDLTDHNRIEGFGEVVAAVKACTTCPILCVFGNNEWTDDLGTYRQKFDLLRPEPAVSYSKNSLLSPMAEIVKVTTKGQLTLPARIRKDLGISEDTYLLAEEIGDYVVLRRAESRFSELSERFRQDAKRKGVTRNSLLRALKGARRGRTS